MAPIGANYLTVYEDFGYGCKFITEYSYLYCKKKYVNGIQRFFSAVKPSSSTQTFLGCHCLCQFWKTSILVCIFWLTSWGLSKKTLISPLVNRYPLFNYLSMATSKTPTRRGVQVPPLPLLAHSSTAIILPLLFHEQSVKGVQGQKERGWRIVVNQIGESEEQTGLLFAQDQLQDQELLQHCYPCPIFETSIVMPQHIFNFTLRFFPPHSVRN